MLQITAWLYSTGIETRRLEAGKVADSAGESCTPFVITLTHILPVKSRPVDLLHKGVLQKHAQDLSTKSLGPIALFSVLVSFVMSTLVHFGGHLISAQQEILAPEACL